jgi:hypothetical protein
MAFGFGESKALDPSGFQISVFITNPTDGVRVPLWTRRDDGGVSLSTDLGAMTADARSAFDQSLGLSSSPGLDLLALDLPIVEGVSLEISKGLIAKTTINIAAPFDLGLKLLESGLFRAGNTYEVQLGYPKLGWVTPWFTSMAQKPTIRITGDEGLSGTLNGDGGSLSATRGQSATVYEGMSYSEIISAIAKRRRWKLVIDKREDIEAFLKTLRVDLGLGAKQHPLDVTRSRVSQRHFSDWFFVQKMVRDSGCSAHMSTSEKGEVTLFVNKRTENLKGAPRYKFIMRGNADFINVFPMFEFEIEPVGVWMPGGAIKTSSRGVDPSTKKVVAVEATAETSPEAALGDGGVPTSAEKDVGGIKVQLADTEGEQRTGEFMYMSARDPRKPKDVCQAHRDELAFRGGVNANISAYAIPELFPADLIELDGVGIFNSIYWIDSMTHDANASEWMMSLKLVNNGSASGGLDETLAATDIQNTNTEQTKEGIAAGSGGSELVNPVPDS